MARSGVNTLFSDFARGWISSVNQPNCSSPNRSSKIDKKNVIMVTLEIPEEQRKAF
jgi:hypothetical protein